ncbi:MAG: protein kinase [Deltaproteobacteria bacterium]|nr:protein kinase [Deltaproteobacteria bacterium]
MSSDPLDPLLGTVVDGRYRVVSRISEGGMGVVYRAEHVFLKRDVALKRLHRELTEQKQAVARFEREAQASAKIAHPNVCQVLDCGVGDDGAFFIAMELLDGTPLDARIAQAAPLPLPELLDIGVQLCDALVRAHELGIVHRDLKPENVMLMPRRDGPGVVPKIMDFGIAKVAQEGDGKKLTQAGMVFGTPQYMAPEQAAGSAVDARADLYALGIILYEMATGRCPFQSDNVSALLMMHLTQPPPPLEAVAPQLRFPEPFRAVVFGCLEKNPAHRIPTAGALGTALRGCAGLQAEPVTVPPPSVAGAVVAPTLLAPPSTVAPHGTLQLTAAAHLAVPTTVGPLTAAAVAGPASYAPPRRRPVWPWLVGFVVLVGLVVLVTVLVLQGGRDDAAIGPATDRRTPTARAERKGAATRRSSEPATAPREPAPPAPPGPSTLSPLFPSLQAATSPASTEVVAALAADREAFEKGDPEVAAALALVPQNRLRQALERLQLLDARLDGNAHYHFHRAVLLSRSGKAAPALDHALRAVELDARYGGSAELLGMAGKALAARGTVEPAERYLARALDVVTAESLARATLETFRSSQHATRVHDLLAGRGLLAGLPPFLALPLRAYGAGDCEARQAVLREIAAAPDARMQPFLRRFKHDSGCAPLGFGDCWPCERAEIRSALAAVDAAAKAAKEAGADAGR